VTTTTRNEAAERLLRDYHKWTHEGIAVGLDAALAAERRATVERLYETIDWDSFTKSGVAKALDEEAAR